MAQISDILSIERERFSLEECRVIHLFLEGSFLRSYEWSAWLCVTMIKEFKVTHRMMKNVDESVAFVGFPQTSLGNHTPVGASVTQMGDKCYDLVLPEIMFQEQDTPEEMNVLFNEWKLSVPLMDPSTKKKEEKTSSSANPFGVEQPSSRPHIMGIMQQILAYPVESKSPIESMLFLAEIKQKLATII